GVAFSQRLSAQLHATGLTDSEDAGVEWFAAPRRLAVRITAVRRRQPDQVMERRGPAVSAAFDDRQNPTPAALGFAKSCGLSIDALLAVDIGGTRRLVHRYTERGKPAAHLLPGCVEEALAKLPIPKRMRWGSGDAEFVRPIHWVVLLHGARVVKGAVLAVKIGDCTRGHRFHSPGPLRISHPDQYAALLRDPGWVLADFAVRRAEILKQVRNAARRRHGTALIDDALLDEVTGLVEWPYALVGEFDQEFLELPSEVLISSMRDHQKYFPVCDEHGALAPYFVTVANIKTKSLRRVRAGNERVLRARLKDAQFFWDSDRKQTLADRRAALKGLLFHKRLGSVFEKSERLGELCAFLASELGLNGDHCKRAAHLAKADLVTDMVGEFPDLQGTMGRYYARLDGEPEAVAEAIGAHYQPRFAGDQLPRGAVAQAVAIADKIDTIVGVFAAGEEPTGDKDPYALRRAALGVLRMVIEEQLDLDLGALIGRSAQLYQSAHADPAACQRASSRAFEFVMERLRTYYLDRGFRPDEIEAVAACATPRPLDFDQRLKGIAIFRGFDEASDLAVASKRIRNILRKAADDVPDSVDTTLLEAPEEKRLARDVDALSTQVAGAFARRDYQGALKRLAGLRDAVDQFFDAVLVMTDDSPVRRNRLALLKRLNGLFLGAADISKLT
ncbi:MAG: glycine--tRNA ligase subunit beta, partial [Gammaproteobacteria bacterium]|nr:glycine--tRNA ligase subunit beta [Gammaproteobacteria bacterium]